MILSKNVVDDILDLDARNMTGILNQYGISFDREVVLRSINNDNPDLRNVHWYYNSNGALAGYFRFVKKEDAILVPSIQLNMELNTWSTFRKLLSQAHECLTVICPEQKIYAWINTKNEPSIKIAEKFGFRYENATRDAIKYFTTAGELRNKLDRYLNKKKVKLSFSSPISVLAHNLPHSFVLNKIDSESKLTAAVLEHGVNPEILYIVGERFKGPYADPDKKQICVNESFLSFLWAFIYGIWVIFEEGIQSPIVKQGNNTFLGEIDFSSNLVQRAKELFSWGVSLPRNWSDWPDQLPSPKFCTSDREEFYVERVNGVYLKAITYLLNHELCHIVNRHWEVLSAIKAIPLTELTETEKVDYKIIETEADKFALESMIYADDDEQTQFHVGLSVVLAHCASIFATTNPSKLTSDFHPDLDNRLFHSINHLQIQDQKNIDYIFFLAAFSLSIFFSFNKQDLSNIGFTHTPPADVEDSKEYFTRMLNEIDRLKDAFNIV